MKLRIHHIGYAVSSIEKSIQKFEVLGYKAIGEVVDDVSRKVRIVFLENSGVHVELIEPTSNDSPVKSLIEKNGPGTYHICYETKGLEETANKLSKQGFKPITSISAAPAIDDRRVLFMYSRECGLIELLEVG
ncbi:VOC family protein [Mesotoga sp. B105.6.4]|uniref:VOC family protein n=1 Tax=Mesotoga sp. B105.6.4 TaxID=1582224 RepID=UPI000CCC0BC8|nr:VOC family protein [Mesotoga sp. B105.6.4]PNS34499.1 hypothetical protein RJ60_14970 [Mesotoga sp. B105.6.4]